MLLLIPEPDLDQGFSQQHYNQFSVKCLTLMQIVLIEEALKHQLVVIPLSQSQPNSLGKKCTASLVGNTRPPYPAQTVSVSWVSNLHILHTCMISKAACMQTYP